MIRLASLVALVTLAGCSFWFGDGDDAPPICADDLPAATGQRDIAPAPLRDPGDLTCDDYGGGPYCNPQCGPCPEATDVRGLTPTPPLPSYNYCGHICESFNESQCAADSQCRVVKFADCVLGPNNCFTDFMGCFPTDTQQDSSVNCWNADAWSCSQSNGCTALHSSESACPTDGNCPRPFELCVPEGQDPGDCFGAVACDRTPPVCPTGTTPGIANGCYTDACIPDKYCAID